MVIGRMVRSLNDLYFRTIGRPALELNGVSRTDSLIGRLRRWARAPVLRIGLTIIALILVALQWQGLDLGGFDQVSPLRAFLAGAVYSAAGVAFALIPTGGVSQRRAFGAGLQAQILKYVPGGIWQAQPIYQSSGGATVAQFGFGVLAAAGLALSLSGSRLLSLLGLLIFVLVEIWVVHKWGPRFAVKLTGLVVTAVVSLWLSGAIIGAGLSLDAPTAGREVAGAWGFGVLVIPIPAGLGVRELYISLADATGEGPILALTHRAVTIIADVVIGVIGLRLAKAGLGKDSA